MFCLSAWMYRFGWLLVKYRTWELQITISNQYLFIFTFIHISFLTLLNLTYIFLASLTCLLLLHRVLYNWVIFCWLGNYFKVRTTIIKESWISHTSIHCFRYRLNVPWWNGASVLVVKQPNVALHWRRSQCEQSCWQFVP